MCRMILRHKGSSETSGAFCTKLESGLIPNSCSCGLTFDPWWSTYCRLLVSVVTAEPADLIHVAVLLHVLKGSAQGVAVGSHPLCVISWCGGQWWWGSAHSTYVVAGHAKIVIAFFWEADAMCCSPLTPCLSVCDTLKLTFCLYTLCCQLVA